MMAAQLHDYILAKTDVKGAYLQTEMTGSQLTASVISILPHLKRFVTPEGTLYTRLLKGLYGCVQSSRLWYEKLIAVLRKLQYEVCPVDPCIMRRIINTKVHLIIIYVDDLFFITDKIEAARLEKELTAEFNWITVTKGETHSYLGMQFILQNHRILIDMLLFIKSTIDEFKKKMGFATIKL
jgi:hypothetical protein